MLKVRDWIRKQQFEIIHQTPGGYVEAKRFKDDKIFINCVNFERNGKIVSITNFSIDMIHVTIKVFDFDLKLEKYETIKINEL